MESRLPRPSAPSVGPAADVALADGQTSKAERTHRRSPLVSPRRSAADSRTAADASASLTQLELGLPCAPPPSLPNDERLTPATLFEPLNAEHRFTVDVAASAANALCNRYFTAANSGLAASWRCERVWCNPPWSQIPWWLEKAWRELRTDCPLAVFLLPDNRTHQRWWQTLVEPFRDRVLGGAVSLRSQFLPNRVHFGTPEDPLALRRSRPRCGVVLPSFARVASW